MALCQRTARVGLAGKKGERKMKIQIEIDEGRAAEIAAWLGKLFDATASTKGGNNSIWHRGGRYDGVRDALGALGIRVKYDRHTKRPVGIEKREDA